MTTKEIIYVTDQFLNVFKSRFDEDYLDLYLESKKEELISLFSTSSNIIKTTIEFDYVPLKLESKDAQATLDNIQIIRESLGFLTPIEASQEKLWVALLNHYYLDYHLDQLSMIERDIEQSIRARTIFTQGSKRSLLQNNLSVLWWIGYYTYDDEAENPYHLTEFFVEGSYRGNALVYLSSNIVSNKNIILGSLEAIQDLVAEEIIRETRYAYTQTNKLLNQIGGVRLIDALEREEIYTIVKQELPKMDRISLI